MFTFEPHHVIAQNSQMSNLISNNYDLESLKRVKAILDHKKTLTLHRYSSGGASAVTVLTDSKYYDFIEGLLTEPLYEESLRNNVLALANLLPNSLTKSTLTSSISGLLCNMWDRDNIMQAIAELDMASDKVPANSPAQWKLGLIASLKHHFIYQQRFIDMIDLKVSGYAKDYGRRPNIRYNAVTLSENPDPWGHAQNDSLAFVNYMLFYTLNRGYVSMEDTELKTYATSYACLLHAMFETVQVWHDYDLGAWEDTAALHASSLMVVIASLREQIKYLNKTGSMTYTIPGRTITVDAQSCQSMLDKCLTSVKQILPNEFINSSNGTTRGADLAFLNPLLLSCLSDEPIIDDDTTIKLLQEIEANLLGTIGIGRYAGDLWDGRINRYDLAPHEIAQWCHGNPMMSMIYGYLYRKTGNRDFYTKQIWYFNRMLASVSSDWLIPEAYIVDLKTRLWVPDANQPLAWATAMSAMSFSDLELSIKFMSAK